VSPIPFISAGFTPDFSTIFLIPERVAFFQSSGFCSAQFGFGIKRGYSSVSDACKTPFSFIRTTFTPLVPTSIPIRYFILFLL